MTDEMMAQRLVEAAEAGSPGNRQRQIQQVAAAAARMPMGFAGVFLGALKIISERAADEDAACHGGRDD